MSASPAFSSERGGKESKRAGAWSRGEMERREGKMGRGTMMGERRGLGGE